MYFIESHTVPLQPQIRKAILQLYRETFDSEPNEKVIQRLDEAPGLHALIAFNADREPIAFKTGYRQDFFTFYSWIGGVVGTYRNQGIASMMMKRQHEWCSEQGYRYIQTKTLNRWRNMLILDLKHGFDIVGVQHGKDGGLRIILEKTLTQEGEQQV
jgi:GNAT superfamily N-acetyltransferase